MTPSTPLWERIGILEGAAVLPVNLPKQVAKALKGAPSHQHVESEADLVWFFLATADGLQQLPSLLAATKPNGAMWISWAHKESKHHVGLDDSAIRAAALELGLHDVKVCIIDDDWSALKFTR